MLMKLLFYLLHLFGRSGARPRVGEDSFWEPRGTRRNHYDCY
jgi:hypothetical protein